MFHGERMGVVKGGRVGRVVARPIVATMLGLTLDVAVVDGQGPEPPLVVRKVRVESVGDGRRVMITLNRAPDGLGYTFMLTVNPDGVAVAVSAKAGSVSILSGRAAKVIV